MSREIDAAALAESQGDHVRPFLAIDLDYPDGVVRATSLDREIEIDGEEYVGASLFGTAGPVTEGVDAQSYGVVVGLAGVPGNFAAYLSSQNVQGRDAAIRLGFVDHAYNVVGQMTVVFVGRMDTQDVSAGKTSSVQVALESLLIDWERPCSRRYTDVDQQAQYPGDLGLQYVASTVNAEFVWG